MILSNHDYREYLKNLDRNDIEMSRLGDDNRFRDIYMESGIYYSSAAFPFFLEMKRALAHLTTIEVMEVWERQERLIQKNPILLLAPSPAPGVPMDREFQDATRAANGEYHN